MPDKLSKAERAVLSKLGRRGGKARAANLTPEQLSESGKKAVAAREAKREERRRAAEAVA